MANVSAGQQTEILSAIDEADTSAAAPDEPCPVCETPRHGDDRFCECCGYDFVTGTLPNGGIAPKGGPTAAAPGPVWVAVVSADRKQLSRFGAEGLNYPEAWTGLTLVLVAPTVHIGRACGQTKPDEQAIDLSGPFADPGVSRQHAMLERLDDGGWTVRDLGSSNGTWINAEPSPMTGMRRLEDGDRIGLGAWTTIELRSRKP
jgi:hypothetical protein